MGTGDATLQRRYFRMLMWFDWPTGKRDWYREPSIGVAGKRGLRMYVGGML